MKMRIVLTMDNAAFDFAAVHVARDIISGALGAMDPETGTGTVSLLDENGNKVGEIRISAR